MQENRTYVCIDLKSFFASVECVERGLDPLTTNLAVADPERSEKTICLAISPSMKALGIKNRCRVFQIPADVKYIKAEPRMKLYVDYSARIYSIYLKYIAKEDIQVYSIDEAFMDVTDYLDMYQLTAKELGIKIMKDILDTTGITATCGIGTNLYLAKIALDITAKHVKDNIGILDEESFKQTLWNHKPLNDFWRIGAGTVKRLATIGISTMGEIAQADEKILYKLFGIDAELMIDHAWGREPVTIADIKAYKAKTNSLSNGQILPRDYACEEGVIIVKEMADLLCLELVDRGLITQSVTIMVAYSNVVEKAPAKGTVNLQDGTSAASVILPAVEKLYFKITDKNCPVRKLNVVFNNVVDETYRQYDMFTDIEEMEREYKMQKSMLAIKKKFGKNAILKGMDLQKSATTMERNRQIGGHKSGE